MTKSVHSANPRSGNKNIPTTERLAQALESLNDPRLADMIQKARAGHYDDFKTELTFPQVQLVIDLRALGGGVFSSRCSPCITLSIQENWFVPPTLSASLSVVGGAGAFRPLPPAAAPARPCTSAPENHHRRSAALASDRRRRWHRVLEMDQRPGRWGGLKFPRCPRAFEAAFHIRA